MIGGRVRETIILAGRVWVDCLGTGSESRDTCAVYVERNADSEAVKPGDAFWWQGGNAFWTPQSREFVGRVIPRMSYSGVNRPCGCEVEGSCHCRDYAEPERCDSSCGFCDPAAAASGAFTSHVKGCGDCKEPFGYCGEGMRLMRASVDAGNV